ncbi:MAG: UDP-2,4-diacetamido-2,4,6-trideoxy-beta-L-altropyranose hydrolase [Lachnospiraceae bacterium]|nr:UDP-2,4-diacetamido-2,4,6-trideoxy-beta-L-altropyranose hydrolase [Lachnospiraceae bacterium]
MINHVYIRVDGNEIIATGHVMRCLSVAEQIRKMGAEVTFVVADDRPCKLIKQKGFFVDVLETIWNELDQETEKLCDYVKEHHVEVLLMDSYFVTEEYLQKVSQYTRIIYIDDLRRFAYPVDTVINYSAFADENLYESVYQLTGINPRFLIGSRYIPLREEFALKSYEVHAQVRKVLITTGGTDQLNVAGDLLDAVLRNSELMELEYHVIVGCFNQNKEMLHLLAGLHSNICLHENVDNMAGWMRECDVAVSAAGTTTYELCACGIPSICLEVAENQEGAVVWEKAGCMLYAGNAYQNHQKCIEQCVKSLLFYKNHYEERKSKSIRMQSLVDGNGARRIAAYVVNEGLQDDIQ